MNDFRKKCLSVLSKSANATLLSKDKDIMRFVQDVKEMTSFLKNPSFKFRVDCVLHEIIENPKCCCKNDLHQRKPSLSFTKYCSNKCRVDSRQNLLLQNKEWLYQKRIVEKLSKERIAILSNSSVQHVNKYIVVHSIPEINLKIDEEIKSMLNKEHLESLYETNTTLEMARIVGCSHSHLAKTMNSLNIDMKPSNSYPRRFNRRSKGEIELVDYIASIYSGTIITSERKLLKGREIDIHLPEKSLAFEYNGLYYHSDTFKNKNYHLNKTEDCLAKDVKLFHIFEDDWLCRKDIVKSRIENLIGLTKRKIYGRQTTVQEIDASTKNLFLDNNHLQGKDCSNIKLGLYHEGALVSVMTFSKARYRKDVEWELSRFANVLNTSVIGGFNKLISHFKKTHNGSIVSYADRSYSFGDVYEKNGFVLERTNSPAYKYIDKNNSLKRYNRQSFTKAQIKKKFNIIEGTEKSIMKSLGFKRIYDCGTLTYILT